MNTEDFEQAFRDSLELKDTFPDADIEQYNKMTFLGYLLGYLSENNL